MSAPPVQAFLGEPFQRARALGTQLEALRADPQLGQRVLEGGEASAEALREALCAPSLFEPGRWVLIRRAEALPDPKALVALLERGLPPQTYLLLEADRLDRRGTLFKWLKAHATVHAFEPPTRQTLPGTVRKMLKDRGVRLGREALQYLLSVVPADLNHIANEIDKLARYASSGPLDLEALQGLLFGGQQLNVFRFLDLLAERKPQALVQLSRLLEGGEEPGKLFYLVVGHLRGLLSVKALVEGGRSPREIAGRLGLAPWLVNRRAQQARYWHEEELVEAVHALHEADVRFKRGQGDPAAALLELTLRWTEVAGHGSRIAPDAPRPVQSR